MKGIKASHDPSPSSLFIKFLGLARILVELLDEREALHKIKKIGSWFTKGVPNGVAFRQKLQQMNEPEVLLAELEALKHGAAA